MVCSNVIIISNIAMFVNAFFIFLLVFLNYSRKIP